MTQVHLTSFTFTAKREERELFRNYNRTPLYRHPLNKDNSLSRSVFLSVPGKNILGDPGAVSRVGRRRDESFQVRARHSWSTLSITLRGYGCCCQCSSVVVDDDQEHHVGEGLGVVFPAVADQSNRGAGRRTVLLLTLLRQAGRSRARVSQVSTLYVKSFSATL